MTDVIYSDDVGIWLLQVADKLSLDAKLLFKSECSKWLESNGATSWIQFCEEHFDIQKHYLSQIYIFPGNLRKEELYLLSQKLSKALEATVTLKRSELVPFPHLKTSEMHMWGSFRYLEASLAKSEKYRNLMTTDAGIKPGRYHAFLDESEDQNKNVYIIGVALIGEDDFERFNNEFVEIREYINKELKEFSYPVYEKRIEDLKSSARSEAARLREGGLPEVHAQHMWQAGGAYSVQGSPDAMARRNSWLLDVAHLFFDYNIHSMAIRLEANLKPFSNADPDKIIHGLYHLGAKYVSRPKVVALLEDIQLKLIYESFIKLDSLLELGVEIVSVTCDKGRRHELFGKFAGFERARKYGYWGNLPNPVFVDSHESNGLQLADFIAYFYLKHHTYKKPDQIFDMIQSAISISFGSLQNSFPSGTRHTYGDPPRRVEALLYAAIAEAVLLHCGGTEETLALRERGADFEVDQILRWGQT